MAMSSSSSRHTKKRPSPSSPPPETRDWATLPVDVLLDVFLRLDAHDIFLGVEMVCKAWRHVAVEEPKLWRRVDMTSVPLEYMDVCVSDAADRSKGLMEAFSGPWEDDLLHCIADGTPLMPELRSMEIYNYVYNNEQLEAILDNCPLLESLHITGHEVNGVMDENLQAKCARVKNLSIPFDFNPSEEDSGDSYFSDEDEL